MILDRFSRLREACLVLGFDNGIFNRGGPREEEWLSSLDETFGADGVDEADLRILEGYFESMTDSERVSVVCGECREMERIANRFPRPGLFRIFDDVFERHV